MATVLDKKHLDKTELGILRVLIDNSRETLSAISEAICGQDTFGMQKPDPEILRRTVAAAGGNTQRAIMIGDSLTDIRTARAADIPVIAVDFGYTDRPVSELDPDRIISRFAQLPEAVAELCVAN